MNFDDISDGPTLRNGTLGKIDQYELLRELGGGAFGHVYLARDTVSRTQVAVKGLPPLVKHNKEELENVKENFALVSKLFHPNIATALHLQKVQSAGYANDEDSAKLRVHAGDPLVVMRYAPGITLSQWRRQSPNKKVPIHKAIEIVRQIASALDYAHGERIIHRDIKPSNIMVDGGIEGKLKVQVLDFGLAAEVRSSMSRLSKEVTDTSGTRQYMAPEQWLGQKQGKETDQYALAVLFYELVVGEVPFTSAFDTGDTSIIINTVTNILPEIPSDLPKTVQNALIKALSKTREDRFSSCMEFVHALEGTVKVSNGNESRKEDGG